MKIQLGPNLNYRLQPSIINRQDVEAVSGRAVPVVGESPIAVRSVVSVSSVVMLSAADIAAVTAIEMTSARIDRNIAAASNAVPVTVRHGAECCGTGKESRWDRTSVWLV